ncbi:hypothetical protein Tco_0557476, partial [Tanacetum coccineum]
MPHEASPNHQGLLLLVMMKANQDQQITQLKNRVKTLEDNEKQREGFVQEDALNMGDDGSKEDLG